MEENKDLNQEEEKVETEETTQEEDTFAKTVDSLKNAVEDVTVGIKNSVDSLVEQLKQVDIDKETITKYVNDFASNVTELADKASVKFNEIKNDPKTNEYLSKAKQTYDNVSQTVVKTATDTYNKAMENEDVNKVVNTVVDKAKDAYQVAGEKYQQFIHDPNVRKTVVSAKEVVESTLDTVVDSIKSTLKKDNDQENKEE
ncbi:MAG: hypothetical protein ACI4WG_05460 [Erysipelotrichaceae bacterium]